MFCGEARHPSVEFLLPDAVLGRAVSGGGPGFTMIPSDLRLRWELASNCSFLSPNCPLFSWSSGSLPSPPLWILAASFMCDSLNHCSDNSYNMYSLIPKSNCPVSDYIFLGKNTLRFISLVIGKYSYYHPFHS